MKKLLLAAALATAAFPACAQTTAGPLPDIDPAMWVVKDADTTIYMFGTFHMLDGKQAWFNDEVKTAFDASQEVVLELVLPENPAELQPLIAKYAIDPNGKTLSSKLTPAVKAKLDKELASFGFPAAQLEPVEPWWASITLVQLGAAKMGLTGEHGPETVITKAAKATSKPVSGLETFDLQLNVFDSMPEATQVKYLDETLDHMAEIPKMLGAMRSAWANGESEKLAAMLNEGLKDDPTLNKVLFVDRNARWAEWIDQRLDKPGTVFMAVGAGHLAGKDSVQDLLAKKGIKSQKVD